MGCNRNCLEKFSDNQCPACFYVSSSLERRDSFSLHPRKTSAESITTCQQQESIKIFHFM